MGRSVLISQPHVPSHIDNLLARRVAFEVGLVVGRQGVGNRDFVLWLAPTPENPDGPVLAQHNVSKVGGKGEKKKGKLSGTGGVFELDVDWIVEHTSQVARMLPGGLAVVGLYIFAPEDSYKGGLVQLSEATRAVKACVTPKCHSAVHAADPYEDQAMLLIHVDSDTSRYSVRHCNTGAKLGDGLHPAEYKFAAVLNQFHHLTCSYQVDLQVVASKSSGKPLRAHAYAMLEAESARIQTAEAMMGQLVPSAEELLSTALVDTPWENCGGGPIPVRLFAQLANTAALSNATGSCQGMCRLTGAVQAHAFAYARESVGAATSLLKQDICQTLRARLDLLCEEADREAEEGEDEGEHGTAGVANKAAHLMHHSVGDTTLQPSSLSLPRRVLLPWLDSLHLCDYLMRGEDAKDALERCKELLGYNLETTEDASTSVRVLENKDRCEIKVGKWNPTKLSAANPKQQGSLRILEVGKAPGSGIPWHACTGLSTLIAIISVGFAYMSLGTQEKACTLEEYMG